MCNKTSSDNGQVSLLNIFFLRTAVGSFRHYAETQGREKWTAEHRSRWSDDAIDLCTSMHTAYSGILGRAFKCFMEVQHRNIATAYLSMTARQVVDANSYEVNRQYQKKKQHQLSVTQTSGQPNHLPFEVINLDGTNFVLD